MKGRNFGVSRCSSSELLLGRRLVRGGSVGVDHVREGTLEAERDQIDDLDIERDEEASRALVPVRVGTEIGQHTSFYVTEASRSPLRVPCGARGAHIT